MFNIFASREETVITVHNETCWACEAIAEIGVALGQPPDDLERRIGVALSDDDLSHVPTFGVLVDQIAERT